MYALTVQIEHLEPMRVASVAITSPSPEEDAINTLLDWAHPQGLLNGRFRFFGYDNCQPEPNHTYTTWLTVKEDVQPSDDVQVIDFPGGRFVMTEVQGVEQISHAWKLLAQWCIDSGFAFAEQPGLEEHLDVLSACPLSECRFRLYLGIKE